MIRHYNIMTLNGSVILDRYHIVQGVDGKHRAEFRYDLSRMSKTPLDRDVIRCVERYDDCALFHQMNACLVSDENNTNEDCLRTALVFVDLKELFYKHKNRSSVPPNTYQNCSESELKSDAGRTARLQWLFDPKNGIRLTCGDGKERVFVPFDKSASMARSSRIAFISADLKKTLERRLLLDIDFSAIQLIPSKYYAYRGLYLSTGKRIAQSAAFRLDHESVIILPDCTARISAAAHTLFTAPKGQPPNENEPWTFGWNENACDLNLSAFDGEGLISPAYAAHINAVLKDDYGFTKDSHSFQIRMPFTKGVLHEVDFAKFFRTYGGDSLFVQDVFGRRRNLSKAQIILTQSMFKCCSWLKKYWKQTGAATDPAVYFFQKMQEYEHTLYITGTDALLSSSAHVQLNYQFLSTLDIPVADFLTWIAKHKKRLHHMTDALAGRSPLLPAALRGAEYTEASADGEVDDGDITKKETEDTLYDKCWNALRKNPKTIGDHIVQDVVRSHIKSMGRAFCKGNFTVSGEIRYLSSDLLALLLYALDGAEGLAANKAAELQKIRKCAAPANTFYMPMPRIPLHANQRYGVLRSPHLSRNEQALLRPHTGSLYEEYFSHLSGVIMTAYRSLIPMTLGGADFDGDLVKIIAEPAVIEAIRRQVYTSNSEANERRLPVIQIPSAHADADIRTPASIPYETLANSFSNDIGKISNIAAKIALKEYWSAEKLPAYENKCAECTIVTGLEIDAAKTGVHPRANIAALQQLVGKEISLFLRGKEELTSEAAGSYASFKVTHNESTETYSLCRRKKPILADVPFYDEHAPVPNIERIPGAYLKYLHEKQTAENEKIRYDADTYFTFARDSGWSDALDKERSAHMAKLSAAYLRVIELSRGIKRMHNLHESAGYGGRLYQILKVQYDDLSQPLSMGVCVNDALSEAGGVIDSQFLSEDEIHDALTRLVSETWHFTKTAGRAEKLSQILGETAVEELSDDAVELLCNFQNGGYMLLYYLLKNKQSDLLAGITPEAYMSRAERQNTGDRKFATPKNNPYWDEFYELYTNAAAEKEDSALWQRALVQRCRNHLRELFSDMDAAFMYAAVQTSKRRFLWDVFTADEILRHIEPTGQAERQT